MRRMVVLVNGLPAAAKGRPRTLLLASGVCTSPGASRGRSMLDGDAPERGAATVRPKPVAGMALVLVALASGVLAIVLVLRPGPPVADRLIGAALMGTCAGFLTYVWRRPLVAVSGGHASFRWFAFGASSIDVEVDDIGSVRLTPCPPPLTALWTIDVLGRDGQVLVSLRTRESLWLRRGPWTAQDASRMAQLLGVPVADRRS